MPLRPGRIEARPSPRAASLGFPNDSPAQEIAGADFKFAECGAGQPAASAGLGGAAAGAGFGGAGAATGAGGGGGAAARRFEISIRSSSIR